MFNKDFRPRRLRTSDTLRRMVRELASGNIDA